MSEQNGDCRDCKFNKAEKPTVYVRCQYPLVAMTNHACLLKNVVLQLAPVSWAASDQNKDREEADWWKGDNNAA